MNLTDSQEENEMRSDYVLYVVAVICFIIAGTFLASAVPEYTLEQAAGQMVIAIFVILGLLFAATGYIVRPKVAAPTPAAPPPLPTEPTPPSPPVAVEEAPVAPPPPPAPAEEQVPPAPPPAEEVAPTPAPTVEEPAKVEEEKPVRRRRRKKAT